MEIRIDLKKINIISAIGAIITICSVFLPYFKVKFLGIELEKCFIDGDGKIVLLVSVIALISIVMNKRLIVIIMGIINLLILIISIFNVQNMMGSNEISQSIAANLVQRSIGFYMLLFGSIVIIGGEIYEYIKGKELKDIIINIDKSQIYNILKYVIVIIAIFSIFMVFAYFNICNWKQVGNRWKYTRAWIFDTKGLKQIEGVYYYFDNDGYMITGKIKLNDTTYYFNDNGAAKNGWVHDGNITHFCNKDGSIVKDTWIDGNNYLCPANRGIYYVDSIGNMVVSQKVVLNGKEYEFDNSGYKMVNWKVTNIYFNTSENSTENMTEISVFSPVYCHFTIDSDEISKGTISKITIFPDGNKSKSSTFDVYNGVGYVTSYPNGIYDNPTYGTTGNLTFQFFDVKNRLIGQGSVLMIK